ncbi:MAG: Fe-S cluster assembly protein SufD, partial [Acidobacteria bacterium]
PTPGAAAAPLVGDGWWAGPLSAAPEGVAAAAREHLGRIAPAEREPFAALGVAAAAEPLVVHVAAGVRAPDLHVPRHVGGADGRPRLGASHLLVLVGENAQVRLIETHTAEDGAPLLAVPLTEIHAEAGARVEHALVQAMPETAFAVATLGVRQLEASRVRQHALAIGGALARLEIHARLDGEGADADLRGLMLARGRQHLDCRSVIDHAVPGATSHETYKAILRDRARTVFAGRIVVREGAQQTDARQQNDNLVLSRHALARTRPQLEIYADDVKCAHGATVGRLDDEALFYLRARGIPLPEARRILIRAFAAAVVDDIPCAPLVERIEAEIDARIPGPEEEEVS